MANNTMDMIEIDPKLFITCRLCLQDMGVYRIVPAVQQQIKYCFDIDVKPFDGMPQLLCKQCETKLSDYYATKKEYIQKQTTLKKKIALNKDNFPPEPEEEKPLEQVNSYQDVEKINTKFKRKRIYSSSSNGTDIDFNKYPSWELLYRKLIVCRLCKNTFDKKCGLKRHLQTHTKLNTCIYKKYKNIIKDCTVSLNRVDDKPNLTGCKDAIVFSQTCIYKQGDAATYHFLYVPNTLRHNRIASSEISIDNESEKHIDTDSSEDELIVKRKQRNNCLSSSDETLVIDGYNKIDKVHNKKQKNLKKQINTECINLDDSSDSTSNANDGLGNLQHKITKKENKYDCNTIQNIIRLCHNKYLKRNKESSKKTKNNRSNLKVKNKILNIGRKTINKQGFNCIGFLRYLEHKNLPIKWIQKANLSKESNHVKIMTKVNNYTPNEKKQESSIWFSAYNLPSSSSKPRKEANETEVNDVTSSTNTIVSQSKENIIPGPSNCAVVNHVDTLIESNKLLNENPVANPKKLPKKSLGTNLHNKPNVTMDESLDSNMCLPVITSTTSLAFTVEPSVILEKPDNQSQSVISDNINVTVPRIKVKPVSELMANNSVNIFNSNEPVENLNQGVSYIQNVDGCYNNMKNIMIERVQGAATVEETYQMSHANVQKKSDSAVTTREYVIMDTVELPNTKTDSPYAYFKNLLQIHNITLLGTDINLTPNFVCLIKFKVLYKQESKEQPVILCLSLFSFKNTFCLKIKDRNEDNINVDKISANWQWEILKIFMGVVVPKLLQNALKVSQETYEYAKNFLCLLKSITFKKDI